MYIQLAPDTVTAGPLNSMQEVSDKLAFFSEPLRKYFRLNEIYIHDWYQILKKDGRKHPNPLLGMCSRIGLSAKEKAIRDTSYRFILFIIMQRKMMRSPSPFNRL